MSDIESDVWCTTHILFCVSADLPTSSSESTSESGGGEGDSLSTATAVVLTLFLSLLVYLQLGVAIGCFIMWCIIRKRQGRGESEKREMVGVIYEEPSLPPKTEPVISLSENEAYGQVTSRN